MRSRGGTIGLVILAFLFAAGCGGRKDMGRVSGTVTYQGKPVPEAVRVVESEPIETLTSCVVAGATALVCRA